jgi:hypothetical protein
LNAAQNIAKYHRTAWCGEDVGGRCTLLNLPSSPPGSAALYTFFYSDDFTVFYWRVAAFDTFLFMLGAVLMFALADAVFGDRVVGMLSSFLLLMMPNSLLYSRSAFSDVPAAFFFLWACLAFAVLCIEKRRRYDGYSVLVLVVALTILSSMRAEYSILLFVALAVIVIDLFFRRFASFARLNSLLVRDRVAIAVAAIGLITVFLFNKFFFGFGTFPSKLFSFAKLNVSYVVPYLSNGASAVLAACFVWYLCYSMWHWRKLRMSGSDFGVVVYGITFLFFVFLYSAYLFSDQTRYLLSVTSIYILVASAGLVSAVGILPWKRVLPAVSMFATMLLALIPLVQNHPSITSPTCTARLLDLLQSLPAKTGGGESFYLLDCGWAAQLTGLQNFTQEQQTALDRLNQGQNLYYLFSPRADWSASLGPSGLWLFPEEDFVFEQVFKNDCNNYIFKIEKKKVE